MNSYNSSIFTRKEILEFLYPTLSNEDIIAYLIVFVGLSDSEFCSLMSQGMGLKLNNLARNKFVIVY
jgi:hypothetical protein